MRRKMIFLTTCIAAMLLFQSVFAAGSQTINNKTEDNKLFAGLVSKAESVALVSMKEELGDRSFNKELPVLDDKIVIWDIKNKCLSDCFYRLPTDIRASSKDTAVTVIMIQDEYAAQTGFYNNGVPAYEYRMRVAIVTSQAEKGILLNMIGESAPQSISGSQKAGYGSKIDLAGFITGVHDRTRALQTSSKKLSTVKNDGVQKIIGIKDRWIYYTGTKGGIYKMKTDGTATEKLNSDNVKMKIQLLGDWIVFNNFEDNVYVLKTNGTGYKRLFRSSSYQAFEGFLYYVDCSDNRIYRMKPDGTGKKKMNNSDADYLAVDNGYVYYSNFFDSGIFRMRTDGTGSKKISSDCAENMVFLGNRIYYQDNYSRSSPCYCSMNSNGTDRKVLKKSIENVVHSGKAFFYVNDEDGLLYKTTDVNGRTSAKINNVSPEWLSASGEMLYFISEGVLYRMKDDGTSRVMVCESDECVLANDTIYIKKNNSLYTISLEGC